MPTRKSVPISERTIWKAIVSALKEAGLGGMRLKDGCCPTDEETLMIRANGSDIFWVHVSQVSEEFAADAIAEWDDSPEL